MHERKIVYMYICLHMHVSVNVCVREERQDGKTLKKISVKTNNSSLYSDMKLDIVFWIFLIMISGFKGYMTVM